LGSPEEKEFLEKHPGINPIQIARAFNTKIDFRNTLSHIADTLKIGVKEENEDTSDKDTVDKLDDKIKAAQQKPSGLGKTENQAGGATNLIDQIASLDTADLAEISDAEEAKILALLEKEELKGD
jgi:hypothetical protein